MLLIPTVENGAAGAAFCQLKRTASALNVSPIWNFTFGRSVNSSVAVAAPAARRTRLNRLPITARCSDAEPTGVPAGVQSGVKMVLANIEKSLRMGRRPNQSAYFLRCRYHASVKLYCKVYFSSIRYFFLYTGSAGGVLLAHPRGCTGIGRRKAEQRGSAQADQCAWGGGKHTRIDRRLM